MDEQPTTTAEAKSLDLLATAINPRQPTADRIACVQELERRAQATDVGGRQ